MLRSTYAKLLNEVRYALHVFTLMPVVILINMKYIFLDWLKQFLVMHCLGIQGLLSKFKDFSRQAVKFKGFSRLYKPCTWVNFKMLYRQRKEKLSLQLQCTSQLHQWCLLRSHALRMGPDDLKKLLHTLGSQLRPPSLLSNGLLKPSASTVPSLS